MCTILCTGHPDFFQLTRLGRFSLLGEITAGLEERADKRMGIAPAGVGYGFLLGKGLRSIGVAEKEGATPVLLMPAGRTALRHSRDLRQLTGLVQRVHAARGQGVAIMGLVG